jgi:hypothetical protein
MIIFVSVPNSQIRFRFDPIISKKLGGDRVASSDAKLVRYSTRHRVYIRAGFASKIFLFQSKTRSLFCIRSASGNEKKIFSLLFASNVLLQKKVNKRGHFFFFRHFFFLSLTKLKTKFFLLHIFPLSEKIKIFAS